jgi:hypothetical protein
MPGTGKQAFRIQLSREAFRRGDVLTTGHAQVRVIKVYRRTLLHRILRKFVWVVYSERIWPDITGQLLKVQPI